MDETPERAYLDDKDIEWRTVKPDFTKVNKLYLNEKTKSHKLGSLEKQVENIVKTFEAEASHKVNKKQWGTVDPDVFRFVVNGVDQGGPDEVIEHGTYNLLMARCPLYKTGNSFEESLEATKGLFPDGFAWELLEVTGGPPKIGITWRHWGWVPDFKDPSKEKKKFEIFASTVITVNDEMKITKLEIFEDAIDYVVMLGESGQMDKFAKCPFNCSK